jgi:hypothetical protein
LKDEGSASALGLPGPGEDERALSPPASLGTTSTGIIGTTRPGLTITGGRKVE